MIWSLLAYLSKLTIAIFLSCPLLVHAEKVWTLENSIEQAIQSSPYILAADAAIESKKGSLSSVSTLENPIIEFGENNKLEKNAGKKGYRFMEASIAQPFPIVRLLYQRKQALSELQAAHYQRFYQQLIQENKVAQAFHNLQLTQANLNFAKNQLTFTKRYQKGKDKKDPLIRYLSKLDDKRLSILLALAQQEVASEEGQYSEALSNFKTLLNLPQNSLAKIAPLKKAKLSAKLSDLLNFQNENHAAIVAAQYMKKAADTNVSIERSKLFPEPTIKYYREKDFLNGKNQFFSGVALNFSMPIWSFNNGGIKKARADADRIKYELIGLERELHAKLRQAHMHLEHLIGQIEHYSKDILPQTKEMYTLTNQSFTSGNVNILALIDANKTYFDSHKNYFKLLYEASVEAANLKLLTGLSVQITDDTSMKNGGNE